MLFPTFNPSTLAKFPKNRVNLEKPIGKDYESRG